ncbi:hypothetical protein QTO34_016814 [Cnephaeus nilssonii]|uniref:Uncharacterized protein n=1 Tax=Cnephaeus nilssonii TaxID=3371016 RepID=A0AA40LQ41_CNENI|nr:hypothetical protein QTO34_016814 [Eptesicus nilssonii]
MKLLHSFCRKGLDWASSRAWRGARGGGPSFLLSELFPKEEPDQSGDRPDTEVCTSQHHDNHIQSKVIEMLKEKAGPYCGVEFTASTGWFKQFKNCYLLHNA